MLLPKIYHFKLSPLRKALHFLKEAILHVCKLSLQHIQGILQIGAAFQECFKGKYALQKCNLVIEEVHRHLFQQTPSFKECNISCKKCIHFQ
jgi:hypothetical protein